MDAGGGATHGAVAERRKGRKEKTGFQEKPLRALRLCGESFV
jgi:hypothetical protein